MKQEVTYFRAAICLLCRSHQCYYNSSTLLSLRKTHSEEATSPSGSQVTKWGYVFFRRCLWSLTSSLWTSQSHFCRTWSPGWPVWSRPRWSSQKDLRDDHIIAERVHHFTSITDNRNCSRCKVKKKKKDWSHKVWVSRFGGIDQLKNGYIDGWRDGW